MASDMSYELTSRTAEKFPSLKKKNQVSMLSHEKYTLNYGYNATEGCMCNAFFAILTF